MMPRPDGSWYAQECCSMCGATPAEECYLRKEFKRMCRRGDFEKEMPDREQKEGG